MTNTLRFYGKIVFQSTNSSGQTYYLTKINLQGSEPLALPSMSAISITDNEKCMVYKDPDGKFVIQLGSLEYICVNELNWLALTDSVDNAAHFEITTTNNQQTWQVLNNSQQTATVQYTVGSSISYLTATGKPVSGTLTTFALSVITPDLDTIITSQNGQNLDFLNVDLSDQDLSGTSGVNFTSANFTNANLSNTIFKKANLSNAVFQGAILDSTSFDGTILNSADFSGSNTVLATVNWGQIQSAVSINFSSCNGQNTQLGASGAAISFKNASFNNGANFSNANLTKLILDGADLTGLTAVSTIFNGASLQGVKAHGANFTGGRFSNANLVNGQFGAKALLFTLATNQNTYVTELNQCQGSAVPDDIIAAFKSQGIDVSKGTASVRSQSQSWLIATGTFNYSILSRPDSTNSAGFVLDIYQDGGVMAAIFNNAHLDHSTCSGANFSSVEMNNSYWDFGVVDHADLESTNLTGSFLLQVFFGQAQLFGTILDNTTLIQAKFTGAVLAPSLENVIPSLTNAQLQGADFTNAQIINGDLDNAAVSLTNGVPLFAISSTDSNYNNYITALNNKDLTTISAVFIGKGYPLGNQASLTSTSAGWFIDNTTDTTPTHIQRFFVDIHPNTDQSLNIYDDSDHNKVLFTLASKYTSFLNNSPPSQALIFYFKQHDYSLSSQATISPDVTAWKITNNSPDAPVKLPVIYENIAILPQSDGLYIYGVSKLWMKNFSYYSSDIAFGPTQNIQGAMNDKTICPNGQAKSVFNTGAYTWEQMMTVSGNS